MIAIGDLRSYLGVAVLVWRRHREKCVPPATFEELTPGWSKAERMAFMAPIYVDAFQSVHCSMFGELVQSSEE